MTPELIIECVAEAFEVKAVELRSYSRKHKVDRARSAAYLLVYEMTGCSLPSAARTLGKADHVCALSGIRNARRRFARDADFAERLEAARIAAVTLDGTSVADHVKSVDAMAVASRVMNDPVRGATQVSTLDLLAMAERLFDFDDVAGAAFQLVAAFDELTEIKRRFPRVYTVRGHEIELRIRSLTDALGGALAVLGYRQQAEQEQSNG